MYRTTLLTMKEGYCWGETRDKCLAHRNRLKLSRTVAASKSRDLESFLRRRLDIVPCLSTRHHHSLRASQAQAWLECQTGIDMICPDLLELWRALNFPLE